MEDKSGYYGEEGEGWWWWKFLLYAIRVSNDGGWEDVYEFF